MKVYIVTNEHYYDTSTAMAVFATLEAAIASMPGVEVYREGYYVTHWENVVAQTEEICGEVTLIREMEVQGAAEMNPPPMSVEDIIADARRHRNPNDPVPTSYDRE
jgi:hypothetical protein